MPVEQYDGVHATCTANAQSILKEGFHLSPEDRYTGAAVYFYDKLKNGLVWAQKFQERRKLQNKCPEGDDGVLLCASINCESDLILDLEEGEYVNSYNEIMDDFWKKCDEIGDALTPTEKKKLSNTVRVRFIKKLQSDLKIQFDMIKIKLPFKKKKYGSGFVVYNVECIQPESISCCKER